MQRIISGWAERARANRMAYFWGLLSRVPSTARTILDLGGLGAFWVQHDLDDHPDVQVIALNLEPHPALHRRVQAVVGDARDLSAWADQSVEIVFSNSLIEHLGTAADQARFAQDVQRIAKRYFIQTPNYWFPLEPHSLVPGFQFLPEAARARLAQRQALGHLPQYTNAAQARAAVHQIRLLTAAQMRGLFPAARLWRERVGFLTKSLVMVGGSWRT